MVSECNLGEENYEKVLRAVYKSRYSGPNCIREETVTSATTEEESNEEEPEEHPSEVDEEATVPCDSSVCIKDIVDSLLECVVHEEHKEPTPPKAGMMYLILNKAYEWVDANTYQKRTSSKRIHSSWINRSSNNSKSGIKKCYFVPKEQNSEFRRWVITMHGMKDTFKLVHIIRQAPSKTLKKRKLPGSASPQYTPWAYEWRKDLSGTTFPVEPKLAFDPSCPSSIPEKPWHIAQDHNAPIWLKSISVNHGPPEGETGIRIRGSGFTKHSKVLWDDEVIGDSMVRSAEEIWYFTPRGPPGQSIQISVINEFPDCVWLTNSFNFTYDVGGFKEGEEPKEAPRRLIDHKYGSKPICAAEGLAQLLSAANTAMNKPSMRPLPSMTVPPPSVPLPSFSIPPVRNYMPQSLPMPLSLAPLDQTKRQKWDHPGVGGITNQLPQIRPGL